MLTRRELLAALAASSVSASAKAVGFDKDDRPIRIVTQFTAGQGSDIFARRFAPYLSERLGKSVIVDNRPGASGQLAAGEVARSAPDGHTLLMAAMGATVTTMALARGRKLTVDFIKDLAPICTCVQISQNLVFSQTAKMATLADFIDYVRAKPNTVSYGSPGVGSTSHLSMELFAHRAKLEMIHVPYKGNPPAYADLIPGRIMLMFDNTTGSLPFVKNNQVKILAVGSPQRVPQLPDVPTIDEAGFGPFDARSWNGFMAPLGTPPEVIQLLSEATGLFFKRADTQTWLKEQAAEAFYRGPKEFGALMKSDLLKWSEVVKTANIQVS
jgi:tripartite-type tricarboxylate transporter receptor subunit TctC